MELAATDTATLSAFSGGACTGTEATLTMLPGGQIPIPGIVSLRRMLGSLTSSDTASALRSLAAGQTQSVVTASIAVSNFSCVGFPDSCPTPG